jgi:hypothetical protein
MGPSRYETLIIQADSLHGVTREYVMRLIEMGVAVGAQRYIVKWMYLTILY